MPDNEQPPEWKFVERNPMSKQRDPIQGEFFNTESISTTADEIVREAIQNALDADTEGEVGVHVRIYVSEDAGALPPTDAATYFEGLWAHATASEPSLDTGLNNRPCRFLVIEDFGTTGLLGDESAYDPPADGSKNDFFYFFRAEGKSGKSGTDRGRWGIGKYVFPKASNINTFFALTVRSEGPQAGTPLLMGQAVLRNHQMPDGSSWEPDGWWAVFPNQIPLPASDSAVINQFRGRWELRRTEEPGLSVVVPYVDPDLNTLAVQRSVVRDYFVAILRGTLTVTIETSGGQAIDINADTIDDAIADLSDASERDELIRNVSLLRWSLDPHTQVTALNSPTGSPHWTPSLIPDDTAAQLRTSIDAGKSLLIRVPVQISRASGGEPQESEFDVLLRPESNIRRVPLFVREGIIVSEVRGRAVTGFRSMVVSYGGAMADLLGDAEGPAHTNWSEKTERFKGSYRYGAAWLSFVRQAPSRIIDIVRGADDEADWTLAKHFFNIPTGGPGPDDGDDDTAGDSEDKQPPIPHPPGGHPLVRVTKNQSEHGFTVTLTNAGSHLKTMDVQVAYDRSRGNPFSKWSPDDFQIEDLQKTLTGGVLTAESGNSISADVTEPAAFALKVTGFDPNRDVRVRTHGRDGS